MHLGIIDSGINDSVCELGESLEAFCDVNDAGEITDKCSYDPTGHGTFNAAILTGRSKQGPAALVPDAKLHVAAAIEGQALVLKTLTALEWMLNLPIDILLMPFGIKGDSPVFSYHIKALIDKGVLPIAAIGNEGAGKFRAPGCYPSVLSAGASDLEGIVAPFSSSQNVKESTECIKPDVCSWGVDVLSPYKKMGTQNGSSMAATVLAGHAARLWQENPGLTNQQMARLICQSTHSLQEGQTHRCRHGIFDIEKARRTLQSRTLQTAPILNPVEYKRYIDPYLKTRCQHFDKEQVSFIMTPVECFSISQVIAEYQSLKIKKTYCHEQLALIQAPTEIALQLMESPDVKLMQATTVPFLSLD